MPVEQSELSEAGTTNDCSQPPTEDHVPPADERCMAIAVSTEERCQRYAVAGTDYCPYHLEDLEFDPEMTG